MFRVPFSPLLLAIASKAPVFLYFLPIRLGLPLGDLTAGPVSESVRALVETDGRSLGLLGASRWPLSVSRCLAAAAQCVQTLTEQQTVVVLTGESC